jgi:hypothetical protein
MMWASSKAHPNSGASAQRNAGVDVDLRPLRRVQGDVARVLSAGESARARPQLIGMSWKITCPEGRVGSQNWTDLLAEASVIEPGLTPLDSGRRHSTKVTTPVALRVPAKPALNVRSPLRFLARFATVSVTSLRATTAECHFTKGGRRGRTKTWGGAGVFEIWPPRRTTRTALHGGAGNGRVAFSAAGKPRAAWLMGYVAWGLTCQNLHLGRVSWTSNRSRPSSM